MLFPIYVLQSKNWKGAQSWSSFAQFVFYSWCCAVCIHVECAISITELDDNRYVTFSIFFCVLFRESTRESWDTFGNQLTIHLTMTHQANECTKIKCQPSKNKISLVENLSFTSVALFSKLQYSRKSKMNNEKKVLSKFEKRNDMKTKLQQPNHHSHHDSEQNDSDQWKSSRRSQCEIFKIQCCIDMKQTKSGKSRQNQIECWALRKRNDFVRYRLPLVDFHLKHFSKILFS